MKLLSINSARAIWLVNTNFLNPKGRNTYPVIAGLVERYKFVKFPEAASLIERPLEIKFEGGTFASADGTPIFTNLSVHDDGFVVETRTSTDESDRFMDDALTWLSETYALPHYTKFPLEKLYGSEVVVQLDSLTNLFSEKFSKFARKLQVSNNPGIPLDLIALNFGPDPSATKKVAPFRLERATGTAFSKQQYFSASPTSTAEHLKLLAAIESAASL